MSDEHNTSSTFALNGRSVLITGGTGSFGQRLAQTLLERHAPRRVVIYSRDEFKQFEMQHREAFRGRHDVMRWFIGDVRDAERLRKAMDKIDIVIHAAALKQVPVAEYNPFEAVKTNILGAENVINAALASDVRRVIALSSDKAAAPINLYGATKLASDKMFVAANNHKGSRDIRFAVVRYGNVMGSRGSVIPFFLEKGRTGVLPITDERMTRFNITLQQGVDFTLACVEHMWGGELFVPRIPSYHLLDVAKAIAPHATIEVVGIRPGEKLHEEMITATDSLATIEFKHHFVILPSTRLWDEERFRKESNGQEGRRCEFGFSYNSGTNDHFLTIEELREVITREVSDAGPLPLQDSVSPKRPEKKVAQAVQPAPSSPAESDTRSDWASGIFERPSRLS